MKNVIVGIVTKLCWWAFPRIIGYIVEYCDHALDLVLGYDHGGLDSTKLRRDGVLRTLTGDYPAVPEFVHRAAIEVVLVVARLGVTRETIDDAAALIAEIDITDLSGAEKRHRALERLRVMYADLPERLLRLVVEMATARRKGERP
jgi:hypothetical protein